MEHLFNLIENNQVFEMMQFMKDNRNTFFKEDELKSFFERRIVKLDNAEKIVCLSGAGGRSIKKPNFTSILALYLSCVPDIFVVKSGSRAVTSLYGSTDFFCDLGMKFDRCDIDRLEHLRFIYYDIDEVAPWKKYTGILTENICIKKYLENNNFGKCSFRKYT